MMVMSRGDLILQDQCRILGLLVHDRIIVPELLLPIHTNKYLYTLVHLSLSFENSIQDQIIVYVLILFMFSEVQR